MTQMSYTEIRFNIRYTTTAVTLCCLLHAAPACAIPSQRNDGADRVPSLSRTGTKAGEAYHAALPAWLPSPLSVVWGSSHPSLSDPVVAINTQKVTAAEGYTLHVDTSGTTLVAHDEAGARHGLRTWRQWRDTAGTLGFTVSDAPALPVRGVHVDLKFHAPRFEWLLQWLDQLAEWKINTVIVEYEDKFPYRQAEGVADRRAWTLSQIHTFDARARELGIEVVPLVQTLGHLEYILRLERYRHLRENPENLSQLCPCCPDSFALIETLLNEVAAAHPGTRHLHIGGDETEWLGFCPACKRRSEELGGHVALYTEYIGRVCNWALAHGLRPVLWDDILRKDPAEVCRLPPGTILMHWDYESDGTPLLPQRATPAGNSPFDRSEPQPVYAQYRKAGFDVWLAPLYASGQLVPDIARSANNCRHLATEAARYDCEGLVGTQWSVLFTPPAFASHGLAALADAAWNPLPTREDMLTIHRPDLATGFNRRFCQQYLGLPDERFGQAMALLDNGPLYRPAGGFPTYLAEPMFVDPCLLFPGQKSSHWVAAFFRPEWRQPVSRYSLKDAWRAKFVSLQNHPQRPVIEAQLTAMRQRALRGTEQLETLLPGVKRNRAYALAMLAGARSRTWRLERLLIQLKQQPAAGGSTNRGEALMQELSINYAESLDPADAKQLAEWLLVGTEE